MSLHTPNEFMMQPCKCHVCYSLIREDQPAVEHSGHGQYIHREDSEERSRHEGYVTIWMHVECATVLALRVASDVMRVRPKDGLRRVVDTLQDTAKKHVLKG